MKIINLLPAEKQAELRYEALFHSFSVAVMLAGAILIAALVAQLGTRVYLTHEKSVTENNIAQIQKVLNKQENNDIKNQIKLINAQMNDFKALADSTPAWSHVLLAFAKQVPDGVKINTFVAAASTRQILITGYAPAREQVIALYNNIHQADTDFSDIDYPLENVAKPADVSFHFTFFIKDQLLQAQSLP